MNLTDLTRAEIKSPSDLMTWADHLERVSSIASPTLYRGQSQVHNNLQPTLARSVKGGAYDAAVLLERRLLESFRKHYVELEALPNDMPSGQELVSKSEVDVLSLMQHYEVPSRLLDWTESVWVAAYFACASHSDQDAELWFVSEAVLDPTPDDMPSGQVKAIVSSSIGKKPADCHPKWGMPYIAVMEPMSNARLRAQMGRLTASDNATVDHAGLLWRLATMKTGSDHPGDFFGRHVIRASRKRDVLRFLAEEKQISAKSLFPDIVGLGRFLRWEFEALRTELY
jgi:FRG domain